MKSALLFRTLFLVILVIFSVNFVVLFVYFPHSSPPFTSFRSKHLDASFRKNRHVETNLRKRQKHRKEERQQRQPPLKIKNAKKKPKQETAEQDSGPKNDANSRRSCSVFGCAVYPPELTDPDLGESIRKFLLSSGYSFEQSSPSAQRKKSTKDAPDNSTKKKIRFADDHFATLSQQGKSHKINQDRAVFFDPFLPDLFVSSPSSSPTKIFLACIFDGHGQLGHEVAQEAVEKFPILLAEKLTLALGGPKDGKNAVMHRGLVENSKNETKDNSDGGGGDTNKNKNNETILVHRENYDAIDAIIRRALNETFLEVNEKGTAHTFLLGGCTASVALRWGSKLFVANAGDSQTILVSASSSDPQYKQQQQQKSLISNVEYETRRDKANQPEERARIEKLGGRIHVNAKGFDPRVIVHSKAANDTIGLAMSRSLGDWEWKAVGVTAEPTIDLIDLSMLLSPLSHSYQTVFLILASDGLWDRRQKHFYATHMAACFRSDGSSNENGEDARSRPLYHLYDVIQKITPKVQEGYRDDITATVIHLQH